MNENDNNPQNPPWAPAPDDEMDVNDTTGGRSLDRLRYLLSTLQRGWKITILRQQPSWCRGTLETIEYYGEEDEEPIDIDYLIRTWGGRKLMIKVHNERGQWVGGGGVSLFSYPPKVRGVEITEADTWGRTPGPNATYSPPIQPPYQPQQAPQLDLTKIIELASRQKGGGDIASILKLAEALSARNVQPLPVNPLAGFEQMAAMAQAFKQMREVFADFGGGGGGDEGGLGSVVPELLKGLVGNMQAKQRPARGALQAPRAEVHRPPVQNPQTPPQSAQSSAATVPDVEKGNIMQIAGLIRDLPPEDAAGCVLLALESMPQSRKDAAMKSFLGQLQGDLPTDYGDDDDEELDG